jgi:hypothetical protein
VKKKSAYEDYKEYIQKMCEQGELVTALSEAEKLYTFPEADKAEVWDIIESIGSSIDDGMIA